MVDVTGFHVFDCVEPWPDKVNFVDSNNTMLGYDMDQQCCEYATWWISTREELADCSFDRHRKTLPPGNWRFDTQPVDCDKFVTYSEQCIAVFRVYTTPRGAWDSEHKEDERFIVLSNTHNGYYSHGFTFDKCTSIEEGSL